jgi:hypothetical protein
MNRFKLNGKKLLVTTIATGCMALALLWPEWRSVSQAYGHYRHMTGTCLCQCIPYAEDMHFSMGNLTKADCDSLAGEECPPPPNAPEGSSPGHYGLCTFGASQTGN